MKQHFVRPEAYLRFGFFQTPGIHRLNLSAAPEFMQTIKILFVTDVHLRSRLSDAHLDGLVKDWASLGADLLLLGGDLAERPKDCLRLIRALEIIDAPLGKFAVLGNNDRECFSNIDELKRQMRASGIVLLVNEASVIPLEGGSLEIAGADEFKYGAPRTRDFESDDPARYQILITHYPIWPDCTPDLILSGHTHGGQFNLLGITPYTLGFEHSKHLIGVRGLFARGKTRAVISSGVGVSRLPLRLGVRPEIELIGFDG